MSPPRRNRLGLPAPIRFDKRSALGRRVEELVGLLRSRALDPDDPLVATEIQRCAETIVISEDLRAQMLRGEPVSAETVLRATRTADLLTRRLQPDRQPVSAVSAAADPAPAELTLAEYLASRYKSSA